MLGVKNIVKIKLELGICWNERLFIGCFLIGVVIGSLAVYLARQFFLEVDLFESLQRIYHAYSIIVAISLAFAIEMANYHGVKSPVEQTMTLYHGTGARRHQSIKDRGLVPEPGSFVYASPDRLMAVVFAAARAELEGDWGLIVQFETKRPWQRDPQFPNSVKSSEPVPPQAIKNLETVDPEEEYQAYQWLKIFVASIRLENAHVLMRASKEHFSGEL